MPYKLRQDENVRDGLRRCAREQLQTAVDELTTGVNDDPVAAVHEARKALKKSRSLLRLARGTIGPDERRRVNAALRNAGRELSSARDAEVMIDATNDLAKRFAGQVPQKTFNTIRRHLEVARDPARRQLLESGVTDQVSHELTVIIAAIDTWPLRRGGWKALQPGLRRSYQDGRELLATARDKPTVESLHEWRKRVKDLWYHLRILKPMSPGIVGGQADEADKLADLLGDDHDLAVLRETLESGASALPVDLDAVLALIDHRRGELEVQAFKIGERLYAERPKAFAQRMHSYWKASRSRSRGRAAALASR
jgi:CHAD domain-containing protein